MSYKKRNLYFALTLPVSYTKNSGRITIPADWIKIWDYPTKLVLKLTAPFVIIGTSEAWEKFDIEIVEREEEED